MEVLKIATQTLQLAIQTAVAGVKSVVDAIKTTADATKIKVDTTANKVDSIDIKVGSLFDGRVVKSIQRGRASFPSLNQGQSFPVTISNVNASKSLYFILEDINSPVEILLTSTALSFKNASSNSSIVIPNLNWQVVEFY